MRNGIASRLLGGITQQDVSLGIVLSIRGLAVVGRHFCGFAVLSMAGFGVLVEGHARLQIFVNGDAGGASLHRASHSVVPC